MLGKKLNQSLWKPFRTYLVIERKFTEKESNINATKSRFNTLVSWFVKEELNLNRRNFNLFIAEKKDKGYSSSYLNNWIKIAKHLDKFLEISELQDYTYFKEERNIDIIPLTAEEITNIANLHINYGRNEAFINKRNRAFYLICGLIGPRPSEMFNLK